MGIKCSQFLELSGMKKARLVAGLIEENKNIRGGHVVETCDCWKHIEPNEVLFICGVGIKNVEEDLKTIVKELSRKNASCMVVETGEYIKETPKSVLELADELDFPIIEIPFSVKINSLIDELYHELFNEEYESHSMENFLRDLIYIEYRDDMKEKAMFYGYQQNKAYIAVIMEFDNFEKFLDKNNVYNKENTKGNVLGIMKNVFEKSRTTKIFYLEEKERFLFMLPIDESADSKKRLRGEIKHIQEKINELYKGLTMSAGIGNQFYRVSDFKKSAVEAKRAMQTAKNGQSRNSIGNYDEIGIYRLFYELQDYEIFVSAMKAILGRLMEYDIDNNSNLVDTLEVYLMNDRNISRAAEELFLHRNTLKYRLNRIEEVLMYDLSDVNTVFNLLLAYKIKGFLLNSGSVM
ncbi:MAG: helix-turn-helix domain-containing protein [Lachnospiraceae bacterium]|nr:helix-turn-helix domain-containing protein [Lachnospiraceae bacterium]